MAPVCVDGSLGQPATCRANSKNRLSHLSLMLVNPYLNVNHGSGLRVTAETQQSIVTNEVRQDHRIAAVFRLHVETRRGVVTWWNH